MEQNPSWKANSPSDSQEFPHILWNHIHKCPPCVPVVGQIQYRYALLKDGDTFWEMRR